MQKATTNKFMLFSTILLVSILCFFAFTIFSTPNFARTTAATDNTNPLVVEHGTKSNSTFTADNDGIITDGKFLLLESNNNTARAIRIYVGTINPTSNNPIYCATINISISRNGTPINTNAVKEETTNNTSYSTFQQIIDINNNTTGKYEIIVNYRLLIDNATDVQRTQIMTFYVHTYNEYNQMNDQPTFDNITPINTGVANSQYYKQFAHYYTNSGTYSATNENNTNPETTFHYVEKQSTDTTKLLYPTITFNPEHYLLTIERVLYKTTETTTMAFTVTSDTNDFTNPSYTLTLSTTINGVTQSISPIESSVTYNNGKFTATITLRDVGEYTIKKQFVRIDGIANRTNGTGFQRLYNTVAPENVEYRFTGNDSSNSSQNITLPERLEINGYQTLYTPSYGKTTPLYKENDNTVYSPNFGYYNGLITTKPTDVNKNNVKALLSTLQNETTTLLPSTNLAPIKFDYLGKVNIGNNSWYVRVDNFGNITVGEFVRGMEFYNSGTYYLCLNITPITGITGNDFYQIICFKITNTPTKPIVKIADNDNANEDATLGVGKYTNQSVYIDWTQPGPFDAKITAQYTCDPSYTNVTDFTATYTKTYTYGTSLTENGTYYVRLIKNGDINTATYTYFHIDNNDISGIRALQVEGKKVDSNTVLSSQTSFKFTVGSPFVWTWDNKKSGASIEYAKYFYAPISAIDGFTLPTQGITNDDDLLVAVNASLGDFSYPADYNRYISGDASASQLINTAQLAVLLLRDEAGNVAIFMTIYDNISPYIIQTPAKTNAQNIIADSTRVIWGSHKAIRITVDSDLTKLFSDTESTSGNGQFTLNTTSITYEKIAYNFDDSITDSIIQYFKANYLAIPITQIKASITPAGSNTETITLNVQQHQEATVVVTKAGLNNSTSTQTYLQATDGTPLSNSVALDQENSANECQYQFNATDYNNMIYSLSMTVNLDQTQGKLYAHKTARNNNAFGYNDQNATTFKAVSQYYATNRNYVSFGWKKPDNNLEIEDITLNYYQLNYDLESENYPYSNNPIEVPIYNRNQLNTGFNESESNGSTYYQTFDLEKLNTGSAEGKYVFTRTYTDQFDTANNETQQGDVKSKTYTYYVERSDILDTNNLGQDTSIEFGYDNYNGYSTNPYSNESRYYNDFSKLLQSNTSTNEFDRFIIGYKNQDQSSYVENTLVSGNLAPISINTFILDGLINKYLNTTSSAKAEYLDTNNYKNFANVIIAVQHYTGQNDNSSPVFTNFYSSYTYSSQSNTNEGNRYKPLSELQNAFTAIGWYRVVMFDLCNSSQNLTGDYAFDLNHLITNDDKPNWNAFTFYLKSSAPEIKLQQKTEGDEQYSSLNITSQKANTNATNIRVTFSEPEAKYMAKIGTITVDLQYSKYDKNYSSKSFTLNINNSTEKDYEYQIDEITPTDDIQLYHIIKPTNSLKQYYVILPRPLEDNATKSKLDCKCIITVTYIKNGNEFAKEEYKIDENGNFETNQYNEKIVSVQGNIDTTTNTINIDNTAPYENLHNLIDNDYNISLLDKLMPGFKNKVKDNIDNPNNTFIQQYAFQIPTTYKFTEDKSADKYFFYKKYSDYQGLLNQQTVVPNTDAFLLEENANRRFSETATDVFTKLEYKNDDYTLSEGYYDIIERDKLGNYRVYTVYVCDTSSELSITHDSKNFTLNMKTSHTWSNGINIENNRVVFNNANVSTDNIAKFTFTPTVNNETEYTKWQIVSVTDDFTGSTTYYIVLPENCLDNTTNYLHNLINIKNVQVVNSIEELNTTLNSMFSTLAIANLNTSGTSLTFNVYNNLTKPTNNAVLYTQSTSFTIRTPGLKLVESMDDLKVSIDNKNNIFTITLPQNSISTQITEFVVKKNNIETKNDKNQIIITNTPGATYTFSYNNIDFYQFLFTDNFGRTTDLRFPIDDTTLKELRFSGKTIGHVKDGATYTYTSSNVDFVYESTYTLLYITIIDFDTGKVVEGWNKKLIDDPREETEFYTTDVDDATETINTLHFKSHNNKHLYYHIQVGITDSNLYDFKFVSYTHFQNISLTDKEGGELWKENTSNKITSKSVKITWQPLANTIQFNPTVRVEKDNMSYAITSGTILEEEGTYRIYLSNDIDENAKEFTTFTIKKYDVSVYEVYQTNALGEYIKLVGLNNSFNHNGTLIKEFFFLGNNWDNIRIIHNEDKQLSQTEENIPNNNFTKIYTISGSGAYKINLQFAVTRIPPSGNTLTNNFTVNGKIQNDSHMNIIPSESTNELQAQIRWTPYYTMPGRESNIENFYYIELVYNNDTSHPIRFYNGDITLTEAGRYSIKLCDIVGQTHKFGFAQNYDAFTLTIYKDVIFTVNNSSAISNAIFNTDVTIAVTDFSNYNTRNFTFVTTKNNLPYEATFTNGQFTFTEPGVYNVSMSGKLSDAGTSARALTASYQFTIIPTNEARQYFEFTPLSGYTITKILKRNYATDDETLPSAWDNVTSLNTNNTSLILSTTNQFGSGIYIVTITIASQQFLPEREFTFRLWINNSTPIITPSRNWGSSAIAGFDLIFNPLSIYERIGNCYLSINGQKVYTFDEETINALENDNPVKLHYSQQGDYIVQIYSASGNLITSNRLTINEPFNTAAIVLIVLFVVLVVGTIIIFVVLRNRMKVR